MSDRRPAVDQSKKPGNGYGTVSPSPTAEALLPPELTPAVLSFQLKLVGSVLGVMTVIERSTLFFLARRKNHPDLPDNETMIPALAIFFIFNAACCFLITGLGAKVAWDARAARLAAAAALRHQLEHPQEVVRAREDAKTTGPMICAAFACPLLAIPGGLILSHNYFFPKLDLDFDILGLAFLFGPAAYFLYRTVSAPVVHLDLEAAGKTSTKGSSASGTNVDASSAVDIMQEDVDTLDTTVT